MKKQSLIFFRAGFTLVELSVVLFIVALLLGGMMSTMTSQVEQRRIKETQRILDEAKEALLGYAVANGQLPCPASPDSNGEESLCTNDTGACGSIVISPFTPTNPRPEHGRCSNPYDGMIPSATLGLSGVDAYGYLPDGWGLTSNRVRYAVYSSQINSVSHPFTAKDGMKAATMTSIAGTSPLLSVCSSAGGITNPGFETAQCPSATRLTNSAVAVVFSLGKNAPTGGSGADEAANIDNDPAFVSHTPADTNAAGGEFDDIVTWLSPNILFNRMIAAGRLP